MTEGSPDIELDIEQLRLLGFGRIKIPTRGKIMLVKYYDRDMVLSFYRDDLTRTVKGIEKKFASEKIEIHKVRVFITYVVQEYLKVLESRHNDNVDKETQEILDAHNLIFTRIKHEKSLHKDISLEDWRKTAREKLDKIKTTTEKNFPNSWSGIEFTLSVLKILNVSQCTLPFAGIILARPGASKTLASSVISIWPWVYYIRNFTAKAFVSHNTAIPKDELPEIDMLPKIRFKALLNPELTPTFSAKDDDLLENIGIITSVLDGRGYVSHTGAHGRRGYYGNYMFVWIGAAVDIPYRVQKLLSTLGPKLYFFRLPFVQKSDEELLEVFNEEYEEKRKQVEDAVIDYLVWWELCPSLYEDKTMSINKIEWDHDSNEKQAMDFIVKLSKFLAPLRAHVDIWSGKNRQHEYTSYEYSFSQPEDPTRAATQLYNLARGHALVYCRSHITVEDVAICAKVVLSTASIERVALMDVLLRNNGKATLSQVVKVHPISKSTALKTMTELNALGIVQLKDVKVNHNDTQQVILMPEFKWLLQKDFVKIIEEFKPVDNSKYPVMCQEKTDEEQFWEIYIELEAKSVGKMVSRSVLEKRLVSSNYFWQSESVSLIDRAISEEKLELVGFDIYRRVGTKKQSESEDTG